jgi:hypothetical protein
MYRKGAVARCVRANDTPSEYLAKLFELRRCSESDSIPVRVLLLGNRPEAECNRSDQELHPEPLCFHHEVHLQSGAAMPSTDSAVCIGKQDSLKGGEGGRDDIHDDLAWLMTVHVDSCKLQATTAALWVH